MISPISLERCPSPRQETKTQHTRQTNTPAYVPLVVYIYASLPSVDPSAYTRDASDPLPYNSQPKNRILIFDLYPYDIAGRFLENYKQSASSINTLNFWRLIICAILGCLNGRFVQKDLRSSRTGDPDVDPLGAEWGTP